MWKRPSYSPGFKLEIKICFVITFHENSTKNNIVVIKFVNTEA
jgi:hypothetical protein